MDVHTKNHYVVQIVYFNTNITQHIISFVTGPPLPTTNLIAIHICLTHFSSLWQITSDPVCGPAPVSYDVTISSANFVRTINIINTSYNFTGLRPMTFYIITVAAVNQAGAGQSSMIVVKTPKMIEALPSGMYQIILSFSIYLKVTTSATADTVHTHVVWHFLDYCCK